MHETDHDKVDNGVDVGALLATRAALTGAREAARFQWRAKNRWVHGAHSRTTIEDFSGGGGDHQHATTFVFDADHPELFAADDSGAAPVEFLLHAIASCLTAGIASVAQNRGVQLASITSTLEGDMDVAGILGIDAEVRNGFSQIRINLEIDGAADDDDLRSIVQQSVRRSAVYDTLTSGVDVSIEVGSSSASRGRSARTAGVPIHIV